MRAVRIETSPFRLLALTDFESRMEKNEHGYAKISGYISGEQKDEMVHMVLEETWGYVRFYDETGGIHILFCGYIADMNIHAEAGTYLLTVLLKTGTGRMDFGQHIRVYQNGGTGCREILEDALEAYGNGSLRMAADAGTICSMAVQYRETDWEFAKRMAARKNTVLLPNDRSEGVRYTFGVAEEQGTELSSYEAYSIQNRIGEYQKKKRQGLTGMTEQDVTAYRVTTREVFYLGDTVVFQGKRYLIGGAERRWEGGEILNDYLLETAGALKQIPYDNKRIIGASLKGIVTDIKKDTVKIFLYEDETGGWAGEKWFAYSTVYSSPDGTGWYCMPEKGDSVRLYFPNEKEAEAYVNSSVNESPSDGTARSNPDDKSIKNKQGKEVRFQPDRLLVTNNKGMSIEIVDNEGIRIESDKSIVIRAKESIGLISSGRGVELSAPEKIVLKQGETALELGGDVTMRGGRVNMQ